MKIVYAKHEPYEDGHLGEVTAEMRLTGPPTIRVVEHDGIYFATEGSHRLAAAKFLGLEPKLLVQTEEIKDSAMDSFWEKVKERLPRYEFDGAVYLRMDCFDELL